jgi:hypothetical protein
MIRASGSDEFNRLLWEAAKHHVSHLDVSEFGQAGELVNPFQLPSKEAADALVQSYFTTLHPLFPILLGPVFMSQYEIFWQTLETPPNTSGWLAILNLDFALGAVHGHTIDAGWVENDRDHVIYFIRARLLSMEPLEMVQVPGVETIQLTTLFGLYLAVSCQVNRSVRYQT